ncbi:E3 ubiquitin ligase family protein [Natronomonas gomsonensis]|uniref:E3 ubiquitin ligase family protein n=1 Tax=Natronomonas gomsonensis TaxID=1046043 RepID=UPI0020CA4857|nr:E3 ubiquitin ligase family protein [Natronomonas gomsonensis]MCY4731892.1 E3 ubiquitin ligase family protein [Natronomonas gomsonensis]
MAALVEWYVFGVVLLFVAVFAVAGYYDAESSGDIIEQRTGTPTTWYMTAGFLGVIAAGIIALYGSLPEGFGGRGDAFALLVHVAPLVVGCGALAVAVDNGLVVLRLVRAKAANTDDIVRQAGTKRIAVTGLVEETPGTSPVFGRQAACWTWSLELGWDDRDIGWQTDQVGSGGVPFALDDGTGAVTVDPREAHIELYGGRRQVYDADDAQPGSVGSNLRSSIGGDRYRYEEAVAAEGRELTVLGEVDTGGTLDADRVIDAGTDDVTLRYAGRSGALTVGGVLAVYLGVRLTAAYFGTPLPF